MTETAPLAVFRDLPCDGVGAAGFLRLESVDAGKNRFRFNTFTWEQTLWGEWAICCTWGRIGGLGRSHVGYLGHCSGNPDGLMDLLAHWRRRGHHHRRSRPENGT